MTLLSNHTVARSILARAFAPARRVGRTVTLAGAVAMGTLVSGCSLSSLVDVNRPSGVLDPAAVQSYSGAVALYDGAVTKFLQSYMGSGAGSNAGPFVTASGMMADEFTEQGIRSGTQADEDSRNDTENPGQKSTSAAPYIYTQLQGNLTSLGQAIPSLRAYAPTAPPALLGTLYLMRGYTELFLGEAFCSGVPLSELAFNGDLIYGKSLTTEQLFQHALAQLDTALAYGADSARILNAARVGRARALLNLNRYDDAAAAVADVPVTASYALNYSSASSVGRGYKPSQLTASDVEGVNGLDFISAHDPRVVIDSIGFTNGTAIRFPRAYNGSTFNVVLANGIEAQLITAEQQLSHEQIADWLQTLNQLRTSCTDAASCATPAPPGTGNVAGLPLLSDPGTEQARVLLLFRERAFWLYGTAHRQGDLRRLVRQYKFSQNKVYPTGPYDTGIPYGPYTNLTPGSDERTWNANYHGCLDREA